MSTDQAAETAATQTAATRPASSETAATRPAATETAAADTTPVERTPVDTIPADPTPADVTSAETTPVDTTADDFTPADTTADDFTPADTAGVDITPEETTPAETTAVTTPTPPSESDAVLERWSKIQVLFVKDPHAAVTAADALIEEIVEARRRAFDAHRGTLTDRWRASDADTEDLRLVLRDYRKVVGDLFPRQP
ncbi:hypothetical protein Caci_6344 [Catenulispora acidiphila DSM 44928]|uniref:Uncharacterized protein n=1 Tax=Catenulispora acidiphila (strain DSM 44928 / JCM 14897 / NBRC 102108 / NRRL B-24433 / ID139908) TaxID=479433 RepID=C7QKC4_CATAD|nr:hypothetical protein [Catenulispora acidiphila]ACU75198.1 hypothetical protein Caci_6344 [Catenulispora acidiphila DSM 44928]